ncbi:DUF1570 domain-containing protein [Pontixanthobacter gangjinensis]|uniref:DUF1570 domain-containing protein n=1 Tax=Pontixanthobacter gangjinensis TaxID=1028742 RepID=A0A6I4SLE7_9SPHN|nr:hypothetical protein [Pontixanthobacter gangjinensis]MXO56533.1 hypothetical protein [Pontixanthobacter gangjinensis]
MLKMVLLRQFVTICAALLIASPAAAETWYKAQTHHFTIYSDGKKRQLEDFAHEVERFDSLLRLLWNKEPLLNPNRLTIYLIKDAQAVDDLLGPRNTNVAGFYRSQAQGSFAVGNRKVSGNKAALSGKRVLFHEYAHHFMFQNFAVPAPAWFTEGFAEFVATAEFKRNGEWTFGAPALHRVNEIEYFGEIPIRDLLTNRPARNSEGSSFYGWSWALTHMLYSQEMGRGKLVTQYINRLNMGQDPLDAAEETFGDLDQFDRKLQTYVKRSIEWNKSPNALPYQDGVTVTELSEYDSQITGLTLQRLGGHNMEEVREELRQAVAMPVATSEAWYQLAEAEFALVHDDDADSAYDFTAAMAAVDQALALDASHMNANVLKGNILLESFDHAEKPDEANWASSREFFNRARATDPLHPWPQYSFANSYIREGESNTEVTKALEIAFEQAPESSELRFAVAIDRARQGNFGEAISMLKILANSPHGGDGAQETIDRINEMMSGQTSRYVDDDDTGTDESDEGNVAADEEEGDSGGDAT